MATFGKSRIEIPAEKVVAILIAIRNWSNSVIMKNIWAKTRSETYLQRDNSGIFAKFGSLEEFHQSIWRLVAQANVSHLE